MTNNSIHNSKIGIKCATGLTDSTFVFNTITNVSYGIKIASWVTLFEDKIGLFDVKMNNLSYNVINSNETGILIQDADAQEIINNDNLNPTFQTNRIDPLVEYNILQSNHITVTTDHYDIQFLGNPRFNIVYNNSFFRSYSSSDLSLAYDEGIANTFGLNYWDIGDHPDENKDGIVDDPYNISGFPNNYDATPLTGPNVSVNHILTGLRVIYPNGKEKIVDLVNIIWSPVIDTEFHNINYSIWLIDNHNNSILITENLSTNEFNLDLNSIPNELKNDFLNISFIPSGTNYYIKIVAKCDQGKTTFDTSDEPFRIIKSISNQFSSSKPSNINFELLSVLILLLSISIRRRQKKEN